MRRARAAFYCTILCLFIACAPNEESIVNNILSGNPDHFKSKVLNKGISPESKVNDGYTLLQYSALNSKKHIVAALLDAKADPNARGKYNRSALHFAGSPEVAKMLIDKGAFVEAEDELGNIPLLMDNLKIETEKVLLEANADVNHQNARGETYLTKAVLEKDEAKVRQALKYKANPFITDDSQFTPLDHASSNGNYKITSILKKHIADNKLTAENPAALTSNETPPEEEVSSPEHNLDNLSERLRYGAAFDINGGEHKPKGYGIQVFAFSKYPMALQKAKKYKNDLQMSDQVYVIQEKTDNKVLYKVVLGKFTTRAAAKARCNEIRSRYGATAGEEKHLGGCFVKAYGDLLDVDGK